MVEIQKSEIVPLYLCLKNLERELDPRLLTVLDRLEKFLYQHLSVEEIENLPELYRCNVDVLDEKV